jgi:hypothetical protein
MHNIHQLSEAVSGTQHLAFYLTTGRLHILCGVCAHLAAIVGLHTFCWWLTLQRGRPALAFAAALDFSLTPGV